MKKTVISMALLALASSGAVAQETKTRSQSFEGERVSGTRTVTYDREAQTRTVDKSLTRNSDGATATSSKVRTRTETGNTLSRTQTGFQGRTRSLNTERVRNGDGSSTLSGSATGRGGRTYGISGQRQRTGNGATSSQRVTGPNGRTVYSRDKSVSRQNGQVNRSVNTSRSRGFNPRRRRR